jgi:hypothetical protein
MEKISAIEFVNKELNNNKVFNDYYSIFQTIEKDNINKNKYNIGDEVKLSKGTLLHGIKSFEKNKIESIKKNGIIFSEYHGVEVFQQKYCVCFWIMNNDILLKDYINSYSAETIHLRNRFTKTYKQIYIPYNYDVRDRQQIFKDINSFIYAIDFVRDSKENQFMPSLIKQDDYIGFILNNKYTDTIKKYDIYTGKLKEEELLSFLPEWVINNTIKKKIPTQTDHELAITFGLPSNLIEGIIVGKLVENDKNKLQYLKDIFKDSYICNLEGKVIMI